MAEDIDWEASSGGKSVLLKPRRLSRAEQTRIAWDAAAQEISEETGIPRVSYAYHDTKNLFVIRLRGTPDKEVVDTLGRRRIESNGVMPLLRKDFEFKGEGKSGYFNKADTEKWVTQIMKWAKSLDGKAEMEAANGTPKTA